MDENGVILAGTSPVRRGQLSPRGAAQVIRQRLPSLTVWEDDRKAGVQRGINLPIVLDDQLVGVVGVTGDPEEVSAFEDMIKRLTEIMVDSVRRQEQSQFAGSGQKSVREENLSRSPLGPFV